MSGKGKVTWQIRSRDEYRPIEWRYGNFQRHFFTIKLHHCGFFKENKLHQTTYINGEVDFVDYVDLDRFILPMVQDFMVALGCSSEHVVQCYFRDPYVAINDGFKRFDKDGFVDFIECILTGLELIDIYIDDLTLKDKISNACEKSVVPLPRERNDGSSCSSSAK